MQMTELPPGIIFYRDMLPALKLLTHDQAGKIFLGAFEYVETGVVPDGLDGAAQIVWHLLSPKIARDIEAYRLKILKNRYAAYKRWAEEKGESCLDFDSWVAKQNADACGRNQSDADACILMPTETETITLTPSETENKAPSLSKAGAATEVGVQGEKEKRSQEDEFNSKRNRAIGLLDGYGA